MLLCPNLIPSYKEQTRMARPGCSEHSSPPRQCAGSDSKLRPEKFILNNRVDVSNRPSEEGIIFLDVELPNRAAILGAFILLNHTNKYVVVRARTSWDEEIDVEDREILLGTRKMIESLFDDFGFETGRSAVKEFSNTIRASDEISITLLDPPDAAADQLSMELFG